MIVHMLNKCALLRNEGEHQLLYQFQKGDRIQARPATDCWMQGDRFGTVDSIGRKWFWIEMERSCQMRGIPPLDIQALAQSADERAIA